MVAEPVEARAQSHTSVCSFALNLSALHLNTSKTPPSLDNLVFLSEAGTVLIFFASFFCIKTKKMKKE
jgi:hypothetical protein